VKWSIGRKIVATFAVAIAILAGIGVATFVSTEQLLRLMVEREKSYQVELETQRLLSNVKDAETGQRGFVITGSDSYLEPYRLGTVEAKATIETLRRLADEDPARRGNLNALEALVDAKFRELQSTIDLRQKEGFDAAAALIKTDEGKKAMDEIRKIVKDMHNEEDRRISGLMVEVDASTARTRGTIVGGAFGAAVVLLFAAWLLARNISSPLAEMTSASRRIAAGELTAAMGTDKRSDEVGELRSAFGRMNSNLGQMAAVARQIAAGDLTAAVKPQSERDELGTYFAPME
jgi:methyl-accepting chemotaxis protein